MSTILKWSSITVVLVGTAMAVLAQNRSGNSIQFDFKDPKGVNTIGIFLDSPLEPIRGLASGVSGVISYDPSHPESFSGKILVDAGSIGLSNAKMTDVMGSEAWLDIRRYFAVQFSFDQVALVSTNEAGVATLKVNGHLRVAGIERPMTVVIKAAYLQNAAAKRGGALSGDLLILRSQFVIQRDLFKIQVGKYLDKVANDVQIDVAIVGYSR